MTRELNAASAAQAVIGWEELLARSDETVRARAQTVTKRSKRTRWAAFCSSGGGGALIVNIVLA